MSDHADGGENDEVCGECGTRTAQVRRALSRRLVAKDAEVERLKAERNRARADGYKRGAEDARRIWAKDADIEAHNKLLSSALSDEVREHMDDNRELRAALDTATRALRECRKEAAAEVKIARAAEDEASNAYAGDDLTEDWHRAALADLMRAEERLSRIDAALAQIEGGKRG